jgi:hypothetical protein
MHTTNTPAQFKTKLGFNWYATAGWRGCMAARKIGMKGVGTLSLAIQLTAAQNATDFQSLKAAAFTDPNAAFKLGRLFETGDGVCQSYSLAYSYYAKAAMLARPVPEAIDAARRTAKLMSDPSLNYELPHNVALLAQKLLNEERRWRADAELISVEVSPTQDNRIRFEFEAASTHEGQWVFLSCSENGLELQDAGRVSWGNAAIPEKFIDLDKALDAARRAGLKGKIESARLSVIVGRAGRHAVWEVVAANFQGDYLIHSASGRSLRRSDIDTPDPLYEQFAKSMAATRQAAVQLPARPVDEAEQRKRMGAMYQQLPIWRQANSGKVFP